MIREQLCDVLSPRVISQEARLYITGFRRRPESRLPNWNLLPEIF